MHTDQFICIRTDLHAYGPVCTHTDRIFIRAATYNTIIAQQHGHKFEYGLYVVMKVFYITRTIHRCIKFFSHFQRLDKSFAIISDISDSWVEFILDVDEIACSCLFGKTWTGGFF